MNDRLQFHEILPDSYKRLISLHQHVEREADKHGVDPKLLELVRIRASQINGCAFCVDLHVKGAQEHGETERRLSLLPVWRDCGQFTPAECAALALTEAITHTSSTQRIDPSIYADAASQFNEEQLGVVVWTAAVIQTFNALNVTSEKKLPAV